MVQFNDLVGRLFDMVCLAETGNLDMLAEIADGLDNLDEIAVAGHQDGCVIGVVECHRKHIDGDCNINALLDKGFVARLQASKSDGQVGYPAKTVEEPLLVAGLFRILAGWDRCVVVVGPNQAATIDQPLNEAVEIQVGSPRTRP